MRQKGIAHLFLLVIVVVVALGAIGYLAYQNGQLRKQAVDMTTNPETFEQMASPTSDPTANERKFWKKSLSYSELDNIYDCGDLPFSFSCSDNSCIEPGIERKVFDIWKSEFLNKYDIDETEFNEYITISDVLATTGGPRKNSGVVIFYLYNVDWVKIGNDSDIKFGDFPLGVIDSDESIRLSARESIKPINYFGEEVISIEELNKKIEDKTPGYKDFDFDYNFCFIENSKEGLILEGIFYDDRKNICYSHLINLINGKTTFSTRRDCLMI